MSLRSIRTFALLLLALTAACGDKKPSGPPDELDGGASPAPEDGGGGSDGDDPVRDGGPKPMADGSVPVDRDAGMDGSVPEVDGSVPTEKNGHVTSVAPTYAVAGESYKYAPKSSEPGQSEWTVKGGPSGMVVEDDKATVAWQPTKEQKGEHKVTVETKANGKTVSQSTTVTVAVSQKQAEVDVSAEKGGTATVMAPASKIQGAGVTVAKAAVSSDKAITVSELSVGPRMLGATGELRAVHFGPSGTVFSTPALISLPLPKDVVLDRERVGAFVYDRKGHWLRVPVVRVDLENRLVYARAAHFSDYAAAQQALDLTLTLARAHEDSGCEGELVAEAYVREQLGELSADVVNNPSEELSALIEDGASDLDALLASPAFHGSLRAVRVIELVSLSDGVEQALAQSVLATTLYAPGDGSATVTHADGLGNVLAKFSFASLVDDGALIGAHLRGEATRARFALDPSGPLSVRGRMHVAYFSEDASLDPVNVDELGVAAVDSAGPEPVEPGFEGVSGDIDCDGLLGDFDAVDDRFSPALHGEPREVVSGVVGAPLTLSAWLTNAPENTSVSFQVVVGNAELTAVNGRDEQRTFVANEPGRFQVEARAMVGSQRFSHLFVIDVAEPAALPSCTPSLGGQSTLKVGESAAVAAVLGESRIPSSALRVEWGLMRTGVLTPSPELGAFGRSATLVPVTPGSYVIGCRTTDGTAFGTIGSASLSVLEAQANRLPVDLAISPPSATLEVGESLALKAWANDPDGEPLTFSWSASGGELTPQEGTEDEDGALFSASEPGQYEVLVRIADPSGIEQELKASVLVVLERADLESEDKDADGWPAMLDCNDEDAAINPAARDACGNQVDEDCSGAPRTSDCDFDGQTIAQGDCDDKDATRHARAPELCDGLDNDCDQAIDETFKVGTTCSAGVGGCATVGAFVCTPDGMNAVCSALAGSPSTELCNGLDDDCDGVPDDGIAAQPSSCGRGACTATGTVSCVQGKPFDSCVPGLAADGDATCDGVDDDCDGALDEEFVSTQTTCGVGACQATGSESCIGGERVDSCRAGTPAGSDATCDGVDDDCDDAVDEDYENAAITCGLGVCQSDGVRTCSGGDEVELCEPLPGDSLDTSCDGIDQDCSGEADEDFVALPEVCNGKDDDCDGLSDEGLSCGGAGSGDCTPKGEEVCNVLDDDCDGAFDEDDVCDLTLSPDSLEGVWWVCLEAGCADLDDSGLMFMPDGRLFTLGTFDGEAYDPAVGPYCADGMDAWQVEGGILTVTVGEGEQTHLLSGYLSIDGLNAVIEWIDPPEPDQDFAYLRRMAEQPGGACPQGPTCQPEQCDNGFDDDCDGQVDQGDPDCVFCTGEPMPEICDGLDNDCNGAIDDLQGSCETPGQGVCQLGKLVCGPGGETMCEPGQPDPAGEVCPDGLDNDCDGLVDEAGCTQLTQGETCLNPIDVSAGGVFHTTLGTRDDVGEACRPRGYRERVFTFTVPSGPGMEYVLRANSSGQHDLGGALFEAPSGWEPSAGCPAFSPRQGMCFGLENHHDFRQYLSSGRTYILLVESSNFEEPQDTAFTLSVARSNDGVCVPGDLDGDQRSICAGDCDDSDPSMYEGAPELCNERDDDCDGIVDEQEGTCSTGLVGVCSLGLSVCGSSGQTCEPIQTASAVDYCGDLADNDCNGQTDDACIEAPGEACTNAINIGTGGTFAGSLLDARDDAVSRCGVGAPGAKELFYRFAVPQGGARLFFNGDYRGGARYALYRDCSLEPVECYLGGQRGDLEPGLYVLAVEQDFEDSQGQPFSFTLGLEDFKGSCLTPDLDGDGFTVCDGDCDETSSAVHPGGSEGTTCDQLDNDCNGGVDDLNAPCTAAGEQGVCAEGRLFCAGLGGEPVCERIGSADPLGRDICGDQLDNDCDGETDEASCVTLPAGDVCSSAIDVGEGGVFAHSLAGFGDDVDAGCGDDVGTGSIERFYTITLDEPRRLRAMATATRGTEVFELPIALSTNCARDTIRACSSFIDEVVEPGTYTLAVFAREPLDYRLSVFSQDPDDFEGITCAPGDLDEDGFNLCTGDCREDDALVHPGAPELCDGLDNDCDFVIDTMQQVEPCIVEGALGACELGKLTCSQGELSCQAERAPGQFPEVCASGIDEDCDGLADDQGTPDVDCTVANGESCALALPLDPEAFTSDSLAGATHEGYGCYGGMNGDAPEKYYRFDAPGPGYLYVTVLPEAPGAVPPHAIGLFADACGDDRRLYCQSGGTTGTYYLERPGPHFLVIESDEPFAYQIQTAFWDGESCSPSDRDGDGQAVCYGDCNDADPDTYAGSAERCDGFDNNCDGAVDNLEFTPCETGLPGVCALGRLACTGEPEPSCVPNTPARANDVCGDELDNDCDGVVDESGCDELPPGELCTLAVDASGGGMFTGSLLGASDDGEHCMGSGTPDRYYTFQLEQPARVFAEVMSSLADGKSQHASLHLFSACEAPVSYTCGSSRIGDYYLEAGVYTLAVEAEQPADYVLFLAFDEGAGCTALGAPAGDFDGDGTSMCANDCSEADPEVHPGAQEVCGNQRDDDCDGYVDHIVNASCTTAMPGECSSGRLECPTVGSVPVCIANVQPNSRPELCGDGIDNDCTDGVDEAQCVEPTGDTCELPFSLNAISSGTTVGLITDDSDDAPGCGGAYTSEEVYRLTAPANGMLFVQAVATAGNTGPFTVRTSEADCFGPYECHGDGRPAGRGVLAGMTYFVTVEGPLDVPFQLTWAMQPEGQQTSCFDGTGTSGDGDFDGDGSSLCQNDCNEANPDVSSGAEEICGNGVDDNCDGTIDQAFGECSTGLFGACALGYFVCQVSGEPASCEPYQPPEEELCGNFFDDDCDGDIDEECISE